MIRQRLVRLRTKHSVIGAIISELIFRHRAHRSSDQTFSTWPVVVCLQLVQSLSIIFGCIPYLKPFFASLESGLIRVDDTRRREGRTSLFSYRLPSKGWVSSSRRFKNRRHQKSRKVEFNAGAEVDGDDGLIGQDRWGRKDEDMENQDSTENFVHATQGDGVPVV